MSLVEKKVIKNESDCIVYSMFVSGDILVPFKTFKESEGHLIE